MDGREPIPLLEDLLVAWPDLRINIDPKHDSAVDALAATLARTGAIDRVCIGSFSDARIARLRQLLGPDAVHLASARRGSPGSAPPASGRPRASSAAACVQVPPAHKNVPIVDERFVRAAHDRLLPVHVWTIDDPVEMHRLLDLGVDGIMTDRPAVLKDVLTARHLWPG